MIGEIDTDGETKAGGVAAGGGCEGSGTFATMERMAKEKGACHGVGELSVFAVMSVGSRSAELDGIGAAVLQGWGCGIHDAMRNFICF